MLTSAEVSRKAFTTVRLREGYDAVEVDTFLADVESTLGALRREIDELRARPPESSESAARVMAMAKETADRIVEAAQREAAEIVDRARERATSLTDEARASAAELLGDARTRHREAVRSAEEVTRYEAELRAGLDDQVSGLRELLRDLERRRRALPPLTVHGQPRHLLVPVQQRPPSAERESESLSDTEAEAEVEANARADARRAG